MKRKGDEMRSEYPEELIKSGARGRFALAYRNELNVVIDPDLRPLFPDARAVNRALREYASLKTTAQKRRRQRTHRSAR